MKLPTDYNRLTRLEKTKARNQYIIEQDGNCYYCGCDLYKSPPKRILSKYINWKLFPIGFLKSPIHLQHNHDTNMTEGAVHSYCNAVMWQYENR